MLKRIRLAALVSCGVCLPASGAWAACSASATMYHATGGSTCTFDATTPGTTTPYNYNGKNYTALISGASTTTVMNVVTDGTMNITVDALIYQTGGGARHAIHVLSGGTINAAGNLTAVSYNSTNSRAVYVNNGTINVGGDLETYRYGTSGTASLQVDTTGVLHVAGNGYVFSMARDIQGFRSYNVATFGGNLTIHHLGETDDRPGGSTALAHRGNLEVGVP